AMVEEGVPGRLGDRLFARDHCPRRQRRVFVVLDVAADRYERYLCGLRVEVAAHGDQRAGIGVEEPVDQHPGLKGLAHPLHAGQEGALRKAVCRFPTARTAEWDSRAGPESRSAACS